MTSQLFKRRAMNLSSDAGSIFPMVLGCFVVIGVLILGCIEITSLFVSQKRLEATAEQGAYVAASSFYLEGEAESVSPRLSVPTAQSNVIWFLNETASEASFAGLRYDETSTVHVTLVSNWSSVLLPSFFGLELQLSAERNSRALLSSE